MAKQTIFENAAFPSVVTVVVGVLIAIFSMSLNAASASTLKILHSFCSWMNCNDGSNPASDGGIRDQIGNIYGTTNYGGKFGEGVVFELIPNANKTKWKETVLKNFCAKPACADGEQPLNDLIIDANGSLYGTTFSGGKFGYGNIFRLSPTGTGWAFTVLHNFCAHSNCPDGANSSSGFAYSGQSSGQPWNQTSPLFATAVGGGRYGHGVMFQLVYDGTSWTETVIHEFQTTNYPDTPIVDNAGNLYGTTETGGKFGWGILYRLAHGSWQQTVLHNFCSQANCADGSVPSGHPVLDTSGNLFGTTEAGGANSNTTICNGDHTCGVVYEYSSAGTFSVRYNFCLLTNCTDGAEPIGGLAIDGSGRLFGTTSSGGFGHNDGVAFLLVNNGGVWSESVLHDFCSLTNCADGSSPEGRLSLDSAGHLWGLTSFGSAANAGTAFELTP
jgi:uncharacterized repeat protein (TIGR03803 family)